LKVCDLEYKIREPTVPLTSELLENTMVEINTTNPLYGKKIVMTKVRDKEIIEFMKKKGAILEDSMKKDVFLLIVKSKDDVSNKTKYAQENGIPIMTPEEFRGTYGSP
jgi:hypothetical protein